MDELKEFLISKGFKLVEIDDDDHYRFAKTVEEMEIIYLLVGPHEGNKNRYMLRGNPIDTFDKWGNCEWQRFYKNIEDFKLNWYRYLLFDEDECN